MKIQAHSAPQTFRSDLGRRGASITAQPQPSDTVELSLPATSSPVKNKWLAGLVETVAIAGVGALAGHFVGGPIVAGVGLTLGLLAGPSSALKTHMDEQDRHSGASPKSWLSFNFELGQREVAIGLRPVAHGPGAVAIGLAPLALGESARSFGVSPTARGERARSMGLFNTEVSGDDCRGLGLYLTTARGERAQATGPVANLAYGEDARARGLVGNLAFGKGAQATGFYFTYVHGEDAAAHGVATSLATGQGSTASGIAFTRSV
jgi:hypothetical protein